jgi:ABC-type transport system involved in multi-copper enzyme maturation permease subunit
MGAGFVLFIYLILVFVASVVIAIIAAIVTALIADREHKGRKVLLAAFAPFVFFFTLFFTGFLGVVAVSGWKGFDIGVGDSWYVKIDGDYSLSMIDMTDSGYIDHNQKQVMSGVTGLQQRGSKIFGMTDDSKYFAIDTKTGHLAEYAYENDFFDKERLTNHDVTLEPVNDFYERRAAELAGNWMIAVGIAAFAISALVTFAICRLVLLGISRKINPVRE